LASLGFQALATTGPGLASRRGRRTVARQELIDCVRAHEPGAAAA